jgi:hypothetical protein
VYLSLETLYLVLITNRASNIVEDLETIRLLSKGTTELLLVKRYRVTLIFCCVVVPDVVGSSTHLTEDKIGDKAFELIFAIDEVCFLSIKLVVVYESSI